MKNKIIQNNLISCGVAVILTAVVCLITFTSFMESSMSVQAENQAYVIREVLHDNTEDPVQALKGMSGSFKSRVTLVGFDGSVLFGANKMNTVMVHPENAAFTVDSSTIYSRDKTELVYYPAALKGDYVVEDSAQNQYDQNRGNRAKIIAKRKRREKLPNRSNCISQQ